VSARFWFPCGLGQRESLPEVGDRFLRPASQGEDGGQVAMEIGEVWHDFQCRFEMPGGFLQLPFRCM